MTRVYVHSFKPGELPWCIDKGEPEEGEVYRKAVLHGRWSSCVAENFNPADRDTKPRCWFEAEEAKVDVIAGTAYVTSFD